MLQQFMYCIYKSVFLGEHSTDVVVTGGYMQRVDAGGCTQQGVKASSKLIITKWSSCFS